jgi:hypothetical protein
MAKGKKETKFTLISSTLIDEGNMLVQNVSNHTVSHPRKPQSHHSAVCSY